MANRRASASATPLGVSRALPAPLIPAITAITAITLLSGCTGGSAPPVPRYTQADATTEEYLAEAQQLELAPGAAWPEDPIPATYRGDEIRYEEGYGTQAADQYWFCTWAEFALAARPDSVDRDRAVAELLALRDTYYFEVLHPQSQPYVERELDAAAAGDLRLVRIDVRQNCTGDPA